MSENTGGGYRIGTIKGRQPKKVTMDGEVALQEALKTHYRAVGSHGTPGASCGAPECSDAIVAILNKRGFTIAALSEPTT